MAPQLSASSDLDNLFGAGSSSGSRATTLGDRDTSVTPLEAKNSWTEMLSVQYDITHHTPRKRGGTK